MMSTIRDVFRLPSGITVLRLNCVHVKLTSRKHYRVGMQVHCEICKREAKRRVRAAVLGAGR